MFHLDRAAADVAEPCLGLRLRCLAWNVCDDARVLSQVCRRNGRRRTWDGLAGTLAARIGWGCGGMPRGCVVCVPVRAAHVGTIRALSSHPVSTFWPTWAVSVHDLAICLDSCAGLVGGHFHHLWCWRNGVAMSILKSLKDADYRLGDLQAIMYNRNDRRVFKPGFLAELYWMLKGSGQYSKREGMGVLETLFCGMADLSFDGVVAYLSTVSIVVLGKWADDEFKVAGLCFPTTRIGSGDQKACFAGYGFTRDWWGTDDQEILAALGIAVLFFEGDVLAIHGIRYETNTLTARFMAKFGFRDIGTIPMYMLRRGKLVGATVSTLSRVDFEENLRLRSEP